MTSHNWHLLLSLSYCLLDQNTKNLLGNKHIHSKLNYWPVIRQDVTCVTDVLVCLHLAQIWSISRWCYYRGTVTAVLSSVWDRCVTCPHRTQVIPYLSCSSLYWYLRLSSVWGTPRRCSSARLRTSNITWDWSPDCRSDTTWERQVFDDINSAPPFTQ